jgi:hypothetical protein
MPLSAATPRCDDAAMQPDGVEGTTLDTEEQRQAVVVKAAAAAGATHAARPSLLRLCTAAAVAAIVAFLMRALTLGRAKPRKTADVLSALPDDVLLNILNHMPPNARLATASVSRRFAALLRRPEAFAVLDFSAPLTHLNGGPLPPLHDAALAALCRRAGGALRVLDTTGDCCAVTGGGVEAALCGGDGSAGANLETLCTCAFAAAADVSAASGVGFLRDRPLASSPLDALFTPLQLLGVRDACPRLRHATVGAVVSAADDLTGVAALTLSMLASLSHGGGGRTALCVLLPRRHWLQKQRPALSQLCTKLHTDTRLHALALLREGRHPLFRAARHASDDEEDEDDPYDGMDGYDVSPCG